MLKKLTYLWLFPPQHEACLHEVYPRWSTVVVIDLLAWLLNCCMVTKLIVFSELYTQNTQTKNTVSSIRFSTAPAPSFRKNRRGRVFPFTTYPPPPGPLFNAGRGGPVYRLTFLLLQVYSRSRNNGETQWHPCLLTEKASSYVMELLSCWVLACVASVESQEVVNWDN